MEKIECSQAKFLADQMLFIEQKKKKCVNGKNTTFWPLDGAEYHSK